MIYQDVEMRNGKIFSGEKIRELTETIINKFSEEKLSPAEGKEVLDTVKNVLDEYAIVQQMAD